MIYEVIEYMPEYQAHRCLVDGERRIVDLMVDGGFSDVPPESLVGRRFGAESETTFIAIAMGVKEIKAA